MLFEKIEWSAKNDHEWGIKNDHQWFMFIPSKTIKTKTAVAGGGKGKEKGKEGSAGGAEFAFFPPLSTEGRVLLRPPKPQRLLGGGQPGPS